MATNGIGVKKVNGSPFKLWDGIQDHGGVIIVPFGTPIVDGDTITTRAMKVPRTMSGMSRIVEALVFWQDNS
jgi:hypothetical protein